LAWSLTWGSQLKFLFSLAADGVEPQALKDRPTLRPELAYYQEVFEELSESRHYSAAGTPLPIPVSEIVSYCELFRVDSLVEREELFRAVRVLDRQFVKQITEQLKPAKPDTKTKSAVA